MKSEEEKDGDKTAAETLKCCASKSVAVKRAPTSGKQDKKSRKKSSTTPGFYPFHTFATRMKIKNCYGFVCRVKVSCIRLNLKILILMKVCMFMKHYRGC